VEKPVEDQQAPLIKEVFSVQRHCQQCGHRWTDQRTIAVAERADLKAQRKAMEDMPVPCRSCHRFPREVMARLFPNGIQRDFVPLMKRAAKRKLIILPILFSLLLPLGGFLLLLAAGASGKWRYAFAVFGLASIVFFLSHAKTVFANRDREKYEVVFRKVGSMSEDEMCEAFAYTFWQDGGIQIPYRWQFARVAALLYWRDHPGADFL